jgi:hypothetical protein
VVEESWLIDGVVPDATLASWKWMDGSTEESLTESKSQESVIEVGFNADALGSLTLRDPMEGESSKESTETESNNDPKGKGKKTETISEEQQVSKWRNRKGKITIN